MKVNVIFRDDRGGLSCDVILEDAQIAVEFSCAITEKFQLLVLVLIATVGRQTIFLRSHLLSSEHSLLYVFLLTVELLFGDLLVVLASGTSNDFVFYILLIIHCRPTWLSTLMAYCVTTKQHTWKTVLVIDGLVASEAGWLVCG